MVSVSQIDFVTPMEQQAGFQTRSSAVFWSLKKFEQTAIYVYIFRGIKYRSNDRISLLFLSTYVN